MTDAARSPPQPSTNSRRATFSSGEEVGRPKEDGCCDDERQSHLDRADDNRENLIEHHHPRPVSAGFCNVAVAATDPRLLLQA
jgi:hypothetical protein